MNEQELPAASKNHQRDDGETRLIAFSPTENRCRKRQSININIYFI